MLACKPVSTPMATSKKLSTHEGEKLGLEEVTKYRRIVGAVQYLSLTRPDLAFSINKRCQYLHSPTSILWTTVKRILRYLKLTLSVGLKIRKSASNILSAFSDADWAGCSDGRTSTGGFTVYFGSILYHGVPRSSLLSLVLALKSSIKPWLMSRPCGFSPFSGNFML
jgi:hypothetical protein